MVFWKDTQFTCHFPFFSVSRVSSSFDMKHLQLQQLLLEPLHPGVNTKTTREVVDNDSGQLQVQTRGSFVSACSSSGQILTESKCLSYSSRMQRGTVQFELGCDT